MVSIQSYLVIAVVIGATCAISSEHRLIQQLLTNYKQAGILGRPVINGTDKIHVNISFGIVQLQEFDQAAQILNFVGWISLEWIDALLGWDPADFNQVQTIVLPDDQIWRPDIRVLNSILPAEPIHETGVHIDKDGHVTWSNVFKYHVFCETSFESDNPTCKMDFASWAYSEPMVSLTHRNQFVNAEYYVQNLEWELSKTKAVTVVRAFPWHPLRQSSQVSFTFTLKRRQKKEDDKDKNKDNGGINTTYSTTLLALSLAMLLISR